MPWESTSCKFCRGDSHINAFDDPSICPWFSQWLCQLQTLQLTQPHHISVISLLPGGCVTCKLCSSHSHIIFPPQSSTKWLCHLQTLQLTQPHHFSIINHLPSGCVSCKLCSSHSHITFPSSAFYQVAVSVANFAAHTATLFFHHQPSTKWPCHLQTLPLTQPHHSFVLLPSGIYEMNHCAGYLKRYINITYHKSYVLRSNDWEKLQCTVN